MQLPFHRPRAGNRAFLLLAVVAILASVGFKNLGDAAGAHSRELLDASHEVELSAIRLEAARITQEAQLKLSRVLPAGDAKNDASEITRVWRADMKDLSEQIVDMDLQEPQVRREAEVLADVLTRKSTLPAVYEDHRDEKLLLTQFHASLVSEALNAATSDDARVGDLISIELYTTGLMSGIIELTLPGGVTAAAVSTDPSMVATYIASLQLLNTAPVSIEEAEPGGLLGEFQAESPEVRSQLWDLVNGARLTEFGEASRAARNDVGLTTAGGERSRPYGSVEELTAATQSLNDEFVKVGSTQLRELSARVADELERTEGRETVWVNLTRILAGLVLLLSAGAVAGFRRNEVALRRRAQSDPLTGLLNREGLDAVMLTMTPTPESPMGLLHVDLDRFKPVNDTYGHQIGDQVLVEVGRRLEEMTHAGHGKDIAAARVGGDEFILVTKNLDEAELRELANEIIAALEHFEFGETALRVGASVGVASCVAETDPKDLILEADLALYHAKRNGRGQTATYERTTGDFIRHVRRSIDEHKLQVAYHPQIDINSGNVLGSEALARVLTPQGKIVPASQWIQIIDWMSGSERLLEALVSAIREDISTGARFPGRIWCNMSPHDLARQGGTRRIVAHLAKTGLPPQRLGVELSESEKIDNPKELAYSVQSLASAGIAVALDNFGVRNMPLGYLVQLPVHRVKLDRAMLTGHPDRVAPARRVTAAIVAMAADLGIDVVAGGVETAAEVPTLRDLKIRIAQGYLFGQPLEWDRHNARPIQRAVDMAPFEDSGPSGTTVVV